MGRRYVDGVNAWTLFQIVGVPGRQRFYQMLFENQVTSVMQEMSNGLDLLVFRLKAKELIYTVLYKFRLLEYTIFITPNASSPSLSPPTFMVLYPQNHV
jgi:hypothetical protein